jgi:hypothetical protein
MIHSAHSTRISFPCGQSERNVLFFLFFLTNKYSSIFFFVVGATTPYLHVSRSKEKNERMIAIYYAKEDKLNADKSSLQNFIRS